MRKSIFLLSSMLVASLCGAGCSSSQKQASATDETEAVFACTDSVTTECDGVKLTQIRDNAQERLMQLSLFGELPQTLIDSLNIGQGVPASVSAFLLEIDGKRILFDTGMRAPDSRLLTNLSAAGVTPADIDYLYLTHFHGDHIGGMMKGDTVVFPKAEVYAAQQEYDAWMQMPDDKKTQVAATMEAYKDRLHRIPAHHRRPAVQPGEIDPVDLAHHLAPHVGVDSPVEMQARERLRNEGAGHPLLLRRL